MKIRKWSPEEDQKTTPRSAIEDLADKMGMNFPLREITMERKADERMLWAEALHGSFPEVEVDISKERPGV